MRTGPGTPTEAEEAAEVADLEHDPFSLEEGLANMLEELDLGIIDKDDHHIQISRVRQAWAGVKDALQAQDGLQKRVHDEDLDDLLDPTMLEDKKTSFWARHKIYIDTEDYPADSLISRLTREWPSGS